MAPSRGLEQAREQRQPDVRGLLCGGYGENKSHTPGVASFFAGPPPRSRTRSPTVTSTLSTSMVTTLTGDHYRSDPDVRQGASAGIDRRGRLRSVDLAARTIIRADDVFPFAVYFAEAVGCPLYALPFGQFLIEKAPQRGFSFTDLTDSYPARTPQPTPQGEAAARAPPGRRSRPDCLWRVTSRAVGAPEPQVRRRRVRRVRRPGGKPIPVTVGLVAQETATHHASRTLGRSSWVPHW